MALKLADYVLESANNPGTGTINLAGAPTGRRAFAIKVSSGDTVYYYITDGTMFENGLGTYTTGTPNTLSRDTVYDNDLGTTAKRNFTGAVQVYIEVPASKRVYLSATGVVTLGDTGKSMSIGGSLNTSGAYSLTFTLSNNTSLTLPTSGTLATLAGAETLSNKTLSNPTISGTGVVGTNSSGNSAVLLQADNVQHKLNGDTASQLGQFSWVNNSGVTVANIWKTGGGATTDPLRIKSCGPVQLHARSVAIDGSAPSLFVDTTEVRPGNDNSATSGAASYRWSTVYAGTGTINTSDAREKDVDQETMLVTPLNDAEIAAAKDLAKELGTYRFLSAIAEKGPAARAHIGMTVQRAIEIMQAHGLDPFGYGFICHDSWEEQVIEFPGVYREHPAEVIEHPEVVDEWGQVEAEAWTEVVREAWTETIAEPSTEIRPAGDRYSFRPDELLMFLARGFDARLSAAGL